jgi:hypothetical protein
MCVLIYKMCVLISSTILLSFGKNAEQKKTTTFGRSTTDPTSPTLDVRHATKLPLSHCKLPLLGMKSGTPKYKACVSSLYLDVRLIQNS